MSGAIFSAFAASAASLLYRIQFITIMQQIVNISTTEFSKEK